METEIINKIFSFGFGGAMAFLLLFVGWKLAIKVVSTFQAMQTEHTNDMKEMQNDHREERAHCYSAQEKRIEGIYDIQEKRIEKFDETIRMFAPK